MLLAEKTLIMKEGNYSGALREADRLKRGHAQVLEFLLRANVEAFKRTQH